MSEFAIDPRLPAGIPDTPGGTVVTVGTMDGVHRGHWAVLEAVRRKAEATGRPGVLATFDPHPLRIVRPEVAPRLLTTPREKREILAETGLEYAVFIPFTPVLAQYSPRRFVEEILIGRLRLGSLVIGYDHGFGRGRSGDVQTLRKIGEEMGFDVEVVPPVLVDGEPISSTRIRKAIEQGDVVSAARGLGRPYSLRGPVVRGDGRGRKLGFPTANIEVGEVDKLLPPDGIYAVRAVLRDDTVDGVLHLGPRPTFAGSPPTIELHLFDFDRDIYGEEVRVDFVARLREIRHFDSVAALVAAIREDCDAARAALGRSGPRARLP
ncbi:MAG TPA: bifunctional riboflavin kinase/FAD synthetase [Longimicrobiales bacterium]|mgnify:FL=1|nr:bifunctional riboflavin kinase/FAD synthetase [Longimicrobiales bacterium]